MWKSFVETRILPDIKEDIHSRLVPSNSSEKEDISFVDLIWQYLLPILLHFHIFGEQYHLANTETKNYPNKHITFFIILEDKESKKKERWPIFHTIFYYFREKRN